MLEDSDVECDVGEAQPVPQAARARLQSRWLEIPLLAKRQTLEAFDMELNGEQDISMWFKSCAAHTTGCKLQRKGLHKVMALDADGICVLTVPRVECLTHQTSFLWTSPYAWARLQALPHLCIRPDVYVLSSTTVVMGSAREYDLIRTQRLFCMAFDWLS
jgi:hypothetical protein